MRTYLCIVFALLCCCGFVWADDAGTVANRPQAASAEQEMTAAKIAKHVAEMQALKSQQTYPVPQDRHGNNNLDEGGEGCTSATVIPALPYSDGGFTGDNVDDYDEVCPYTGSTSPDVVYSYSPAVNQNVTISLCASSDYDTKVYVYENTCASGTALYCNDDWCSTPNFPSPYVSYLECVALTAGNTYYIVVDGYFGSSGNYSLDVTDCAPPPCVADYAVTAPVVVPGNTCGAGDDCDIVGGGTEDHIVEVTIPYASQWQIQLCDEGVGFWDSYMCLGTTCCSGDIWCQDDGGCGPLNYYLSKFPCLTLAAGTYYLAIEGLYSGQCGGYTLSIQECVVGRCCYQGACLEGYAEQDCINLGGLWGGANSTCTSNPCPPPAGTLRVINVPVPCSIGVSIGADCRGDLYYTCYGEGILYRMDEFGNLIDQHTILDAAGNTIFIDEIGWDESRQLFWGGELNTNAIWTVDRLGNAVYQFPGQAGIPLTDGCDYDGTDGTIWHSTDVSGDIAHFDDTGLLLGSLTLFDEFGNPEGTISGIEMGASNTIFAGNSPIDDVRRCDKTTGAFVSRFDAGQVRCEGMECDAINFAPLVALWVKDAYNNTVTAFQIDSGTCVCAQLPDTCQFPYEEIDDGDLPRCNYPTIHANPGHGLSGVAWLGPLIDGEAAPNILDLDAFDDGVIYHGLPWTPCLPASVTVHVTAGPNYGRYSECGGQLYLNGWKDGNLDGDFCDLLPCDPGLFADEWIVQDLLVFPGAWPLSFIDPGVFDLGTYDGVFRWRLTSQPVGRFGFGLLDPSCNIPCPATYGLDYLGEVEDYIIADAQLNVELSSFDLIGRDGEVAVTWTTASETDNDHFEIVRNGSTVAQIPASANATGGAYNWVDTDVTNGTSYSYTLVAVDAAGARQELATESATPSVNVAVISEYALHQNYPNPFNPNTSITFDLLESGLTTVKVYDLMGREIATLVNSNLTAGRHTISFDASGLPSGVYLYKLNVNGFEAQNKMLLLK